MESSLVLQLEDIPDTRDQIMGAILLPSNEPPLNQLEAQPVPSFSAPIPISNATIDSGVQRLLSEPRPFSHKTSQTSGLTQKIHGPTISVQEELKSGLVSEPEGIIPDIIPRITGAVPPSPSDVPPLDRHEAQPSPSVPTSDATRDPAISNHSGPLKLLRAIRRYFRRFKRKLSSSD